MLRDALVEVLRHDIKSVSLGFTSITGVEVSPDLHLARVFMSGLKEDETRARVEDLQRLRGVVRSCLGRRIRLRFTPELDFRYDETTMRASRVEELLHKHAPPSREENDDHNDDQS